MQDPPAISPFRRALRVLGDFALGVWGIFWLAATACTIIWNYWRSRYLVNRWAADNAYELVHREYRILRRGPFFWSPRCGHIVHYITVRNRHGIQRSGFVRVGGLWRALVSGAVEVKWETADSATVQSSDPSTGTAKTPMETSKD